MSSAAAIRRSTGCARTAANRRALCVADENLRNPVIVREAHDFGNGILSPQNMNFRTQFASRVQVGLQSQRVFGFQPRLRHIGDEQLAVKAVGIAGPLSIIARALLRGVMQTRIRSCVPQVWRMPCRSM